jgi:asparagine synthase (glutamine-hydrolysing)
MCGISIILKKESYPCSGLVLEKMNDEIIHRGPDDSGTLFFSKKEVQQDLNSTSNNWNLALGHRRLSILDLSSAGKQPMSYQDRYWITFNGEIYNYLELRKELAEKGYQFNTQTDTEVILAAYSEWGLNCFSRFNGMWSMGVYDKAEEKLILCRDRMGIKPLYLYLEKDIIVACSEIKQLRHLPDFKMMVNKPFLYEYINTGYERYNESFFEGINPLEPGAVQVIDTNTLSVTQTKSYWNPSCNGAIIKDSEEAGVLFEEMLNSATNLRLRSDVPVGSFLSGGLDSSSIVSLISENTNGNSKVKTFSAVFDGYEMDETNYIKKILDFVPSVDGYFTSPQFENFNASLKKMIWHNDEPVGGPSVFASYSVAQLARKNDTSVILNGQGGDEILGGYWQLYYVHLFNAIKKGRVGHVLNNIFGCLGKNGNADLVKNAPFIVKRYLARKNKLSVNLKIEGQRSSNYLDNYLSLSTPERRINDIRYLFLPRLLKWEDRNTMAFSIEGRYPFLDYRLIELCLNFSDEVLYKAGWTKMPIRNGLKNKLPLSIINRKSKYGFEVPQNNWLDAYLVHNNFPNGKEIPLYQVIEKVELNKLVENYRINKQNDSAQLIFRLIFVNAWLELFDLQV